MKFNYICITICFLLVCKNLVAQLNPPPGTIQIDSILYIDQSEISNIAYWEYLYTINRDSTKALYRQSLPDSTVIISNSFKRNDSIMDYVYYFRSRQFKDFPLVGVTFEQAQNYCKWRTDAVRQILHIKGELDSTKFNINYRLPSIQEWIKVGIASDYDLKRKNKQFEKLPFGNVDRKGLKKIAKENKFHISSKDYEELLINYLKEHPIHLLDNLSYKGNNIHLEKALNANFPLASRLYNNNKEIIYDLRGNVSEMTSIKGVAKGGNWSTAEGEISLFDNVKYTTPSGIIGFRCICEINPINLN